MILLTAALLIVSRGDQLQMMDIDSELSGQHVQAPLMCEHHHQPLYETLFVQFTSLSLVFLMVDAHT